MFFVRAVSSSSLSSNRLALSSTLSPISKSSFRVSLHYVWTYLKPAEILFEADAAVGGLLTGREGRIDGVGSTLAVSEAFSFASQRCYPLFLACTWSQKLEFCAYFAFMN